MIKFWSLCGLIYNVVYFIVIFYRGEYLYNDFNKEIILDNFFF